jgi:hypothetical protein
MNLGTWESTYNVTPGAAGTPQGDGVPNIVKFFDDINPTRPMTAADRAALPAMGLTTINGVSYLTLTYRQNPLESGLQVNVQSSTTLVPVNQTPAWTMVSPPDFSQQVGTDAATGDPIMEVGVKTGSSTKQYIRLNLGTSP